MIQGGDPTGTGRGGESIYGFLFFFLLENSQKLNYKHYMYKVESLKMKLIQN